jgi:flagellin-like hook-associated protein FlgL
LTVINTNVGALMARTYATRASDKMQTSMERLSSGLRINSAADDAAGLAVANKMASQLKGIKMAIRNSQDGISLVQTAESGMSQISSMILRMRELAIQMDNGIYTDKDRDNAEMEDQALRAEVDKVVANTRFNDVSLLDGSYDQTVRAGNTNAESTRIAIDGMTNLVNEDSYLPQSLSDIANGKGGFIVNGANAGDTAGRRVSEAGDVNGDGLDDFIIGARQADPNGADSGAAYVVFGRKDGGNVELSDIEAGIGGFVIKGVSAGDNAGASAHGGSDVNGDGLADIVVGARHDDPNGDASGAAFVVFGKKDTTAVELSAIEAGIGGFVINGANAGDTAGNKAVLTGDINGDGIDDILVSAERDGSNGANAGAAYVVFGKSDTTAVELSAVAAGTGGFIIKGASAGDFAGWLSQAGDVNGDGYYDLAITAPDADPGGQSSAGSVYIVFGKSDTGAVELSNIDVGNGGYAIHGISADDWAGWDVDGGTDVNGDGLPDLLIGASQAYNGADRTGAAYVVYGKKTTESVELSDVEAGNGGFVIKGIGDGDQTAAVALGGDFNGDGLGDIVVGARRNDTLGVNAGAAFVVFGSKSGGSVELATLDESGRGFSLFGLGAGDFTGSAVNFAGDLNGDGYDDVLLGARNAGPGGRVDAGTTYVVYGVGRIGILDDALEEVSTAQAKLGAIQNRLTHNINNLSKSSMLTEQALGRVIDADFATETSLLSKQQILNQAATAMLAQANMSKESVLVLLE